MGAVGKCNHCLPYLGFVPYHKISYKRRLGKVAVFALLRGTRPAWYFAGGPSSRLAFTKLIPLGYFVNFES